MPAELVECIPNFSEGRRSEIIAQIEAAIRSVPGVSILDQHSDHDHNRTVITFVASPETALQAAFQGIKTAAEIIDMTQHEGEHPRIGAADVVPFVPIRGVSMEVCVELARRLGERVGQELEIPVYLYESAATRPDRVNLENIRRGEYEALKDAIQTDDDRKPDFGPARLGKAGATVIGARAPLIAYNVYLTSDDVSIAKKIARAIRHSSGGLRFVKSIGLLVDGRAQVSMNLTDFKRTPIARVVEMIRREAQRYGVSIHRSELVGLAPQAALVEAAQWYLQLDKLQADQILENRLYEAQSGADDVGFLDRLAEGTATPGGGSAAAHVAATAAALVAMVARLTMGKKKYADVEARMGEIAAQADERRGTLVDAARRDAEAFDAVMAALKLPKETQAERQARAEALESATHRAAEVPLEVAQHASVILGMAAELARSGNVNAASDAGAAGLMAKAALQAAGLNVRINAQSATDQSAVEEWLGTLDLLESDAAEAEERLRRALEERSELALGA